MTVAEVHKLPADPGLESRVIEVPISHHGPMPRARDLPAAVGVRVLAAGLVAALVGALVVACTPSEESDPPGQSDPDNAALTVTTKGAGRMGDDLRAQMEAEVSDVLAGYVVGGFLGDYPRQDFVDAFVDFTSRATQFAAADIDVLTGSRFEDASAVTATSLDAELHFFVRGGAAVGASAYVDFAFDVDAKEEGEGTTASLTGRFTLGHTDDGWLVFGYDVLRDDSDALPAEASS